MDPCRAGRKIPAFAPARRHPDISRRPLACGAGRSQMSRLNGAASALVVALAAAGCASFDGSAPRASLRDANALHAQASLKGVARADGAWPATDWWTGSGDGQPAAP